MAVAALGALTVLVGIGSLVPAASGHRAVTHAAFAQQCADPFPVHRNPSNPLMLSPAPPAGNPLVGARFFVDGPAHGSAAGAIAHLLGIDTSTPLGTALPGFPDRESWGTFARFVAEELPTVRKSVAHEVRELEKIAAEPEPQRISLFSQGGTPAGIFDQTQKLFCQNFSADPGAIPIINTYFLHPELGGCPTLASIDAYVPTFEAQIQALAAGVANRPAVLLLELDAIGSSACIAKAGLLPEWEAMLHYEVDALSSLPHTVVYLEGGYSDANTPAYAARILNASGVSQTEGFYTNGTHLNWTINEIKYGEKISKLTNGAHFVINTALNGNGPKRNPHPRTQGVEDLCNAPGRALGPRPTTHTGYTDVDAFLWVIVPGNSSGTCGGGPPSGVFWPARAIGLAERANARLGPHFPSRPY